MRDARRRSIRVVSSRREFYEESICHYIKNMLWVGAVEKNEVFEKPSLVLVYYLNSYAFHFDHISEACITISC